MCRLSLMSALAVGALVQSVSGYEGGLRDRKGAHRVNCQMTKWSAGVCDATGHKTLTRSVLVPPSNGGSPCPPSTTVEKCKPSECWMAWSAWVCDSSSGMKERTQQIAPGGMQLAKKCPLAVERAVCDPVPCVVNTLEEDVANPWGKCTFDDATGWTKTKTLGIKSKELYGGAPCSDASRVAVATCPPEQCQWSTTEYDEWTSCDATNVKYHPFKITQQPQYGAPPCPSVEQRADVVACVNCVVSAWVVPDDCTKNAVSGAWEKTWTRTVTTPEQNGGTPCGDLTKTETCAAVDCQYTGDPTSCSLDAASHWVTSTVVVTTPARYGGAGCPSPSSCDVEQYCNPLADPTEKAECTSALAKIGPIKVGYGVYASRGDLVSANTFWGCAEACAARVECVAFNKFTDDSYCWLLYDVDYGLNRDREDTAMMLSTLQTICIYERFLSADSGIDLPLPNSGQTATSVSECCVACRNTLECKGFTFIKSMCVLKSSVTGGVAGAMEYMGLMA